MADMIDQDDLIDRLSRYMYQVAAEPQAPEDQCARDGIVAGMAISIGITAGAVGPIDGAELGYVGASIAATAIDRMESE